MRLADDLGRQGGDVTEIFCSRCGHRNPSESNFCSSCGGAGGSDEDHPTAAFQLDAPTGEEVTSIEMGDVPAGGLLVVRSGPSAGSRFAIEKDLITAGRHPDSDIFLDDITVSRRHAEIIRQGAGYVVRDVGSLNGTYVNRDRIEESRLEDGDEVQIGKFKLVFVAGPGPGE
ncbi:MAG: FHA domain-containing protein [Acidimicrobiales bacterium]